MVPVVVGINRDQECHQVITIVNHNCFVNVFMCKAADRIRMGSDGDGGTLGHGCSHLREVLELLTAALAIHGSRGEFLLLGALEGPSLLG